jgi:short-subunit dehydrogenase
MDSLSSKVNQRVALITGASSGIGRATAVAFAKAGVHVVGTARRRDRLAELESEINALPEPHGQFLAVTGDVTSAESMQNVVQQTLERFGRLDILVANAGIGHRGAIVDAEWADLETVLRTNIDGVLHSIRAAVPAMRQTGGGHIITISSVVHNLVSPYAATYAASKAFVTSMARSVRIELERDHIKVTDFLVGRTHTEFNAKRLGAGSRQSSRIPTMPPEKVANAIVKATSQSKKTVYLRLMDRLTVLANTVVPGIMAYIAKRQYEPQRDI